jgi:predicted DCC family thiol-disulfide oxidoreductase YuxK
MRFDNKQKILFVTLQSDFAKKELPQNLTDHLSTLVVKKGDQIFVKSEAVFLIIQELGGIFKTLLIFQVLPVGLCNWVYDLVAQSRYQIFGKKNTCRIPTPEERSRFIV